MISGITKDLLSLVDGSDKYDDISNNSRKQEIRKLRSCLKSCDNMEWSGSLVQDPLLKDWPDVILFGKSIFGREVKSCQRLDSVTFTPMGYKEHYVPDRVGKSVTLKPNKSEGTMTIYIYEESSVDLSHYVAYLLSLGKKYVHIAVRKRGCRNVRVSFSANEFSEKEDNLVVVSKSLPTLKESLLDRPEHVVLRMNNRVTSLSLSKAGESYPPLSLTSSDGYLAATKGVWVVAKYSDFGFELFLTESQSSRYSIADWVMSVLSTVLQGRYILSPIYDDESLQGYRVRELDISAIETCHITNTWECDPGDTYRLFEKRCSGRYQEPPDPQISDYYSAYSVTPYIRFYFRRGCSHSILPCGVCPSSGFKGMKNEHLSRIRKIKNFNYGVVGTGDFRTDALGANIVVTSPSYGVRFVKYQSSKMVPYILSSYSMSPRLCNCSFGSACYECNLDPKVTAEGFLRVLKGSKSYDMCNDYGIYSYLGRSYVISLNFNLSPSYISIGMKGDQSIARRRHSKIVEASRCVSLLYEEFRSTFTSVYSPKPLKDHYDKLFFSVLRMVANGSSTGRYLHSWRVVHALFGNVDDTFKFDTHRASKELAQTIWLLTILVNDDDLGASVSQPKFEYVKEALPT